MGRKHRRKHDHKEAYEDKPASVPNPPSEKPNTQQFERIHQEGQKKEEPTNWWRSPEWVKAVFEGILAFFAFASFIAVWIQLNDSRKALVVDQRAWVAIQEPETVGRTINTIPGMGVMMYVQRVRVVISNTGKTPALNITQDEPICVTQPFPNFENPNYDIEIKKRQKLQAEEKARGRLIPLSECPVPIIKYRGGVLAPAAKQTAYLVSDDISFRLIAPEEMSQPSNKSPGTIYILGRFTYQDIFSPKQHTTKFCLWSHGEDFRVCGEGNWMD